MAPLVDQRCSRPETGAPNLVGLFILCGQLVRFSPLSPSILPSVSLSPINSFFSFFHFLPGQALAGNDYVLDYFFLSFDTFLSLFLSLAFLSP